MDIQTKYFLMSKGAGRGRGKQGGVPLSSKRGPKKGFKGPVKKKKEKIEAQVVKVTDEVEGNFNDQELFKKAYIAVENMLSRANAEGDMEKQQCAVGSLLTYMKAKSLNMNPIIEMIANANTKQLRLLEASLRNEGILENIKRGKATLHDVYRLPQIKRRSKK